jgi:hypothetical protein
VRDPFGHSVRIHSPERTDEFQSLHQKAFSVLKGDGKHKKKATVEDFIKAWNSLSPHVEEEEWKLYNE